MAGKTARHTQKSSAEPSASAPKPKRRIPEPFHLVEASIARTGDVTVKVPMLVLRGEWLRACGFPIGSAAYVTPDRRGALTLHRLGLGVPRRVRVVAESG